MPACGAVNIGLNPLWSAAARCQKAGRWGASLSSKRPRRIVTAGGFGGYKQRNPAFQIVLPGSHRPSTAGRLKASPRRVCFGNSLFTSGFRGSDIHTPVLKTRQGYEEQAIAIL